MVLPVSVDALGDYCNVLLENSLTDLFGLFCQGCDLGLVNHLVVGLVVQVF